MSLPRKKRTPPRAEPRGPVTVFVAGCFNRVHSAHLRLLRAARVLGDRLVVVLSNDSHNRKPNAVAAARRRKWVQALGLADRVIIGDAKGFAGTVRRENPDILVLGYDQKLPDPETERAVLDMGVAVVRMPWFPGKEDFSSSSCR